MPLTKRSVPAENGIRGQSQQTSALLQLRELILSGAFRAGERMPEIPLAERLRVSRTPLRLALSALQHEGLLEFHVTRGFVVRAFTLKDIFDSIELRGVIEGLAGRLAIERLPHDPGLAREWMAPFRDCLLHLESTIDALETGPAEALGSYIAANDKFHRLIAVLSQSPSVQRELDRVNLLPFAAPGGAFLRLQAKLPESRRLIRIGQDQHQAIVEALEAREASRLEALLREHARLARRNLEIVLANAEFHHLIPGLRLIQDRQDRQDRNLQEPRNGKAEKH